MRVLLDRDLQEWEAWAAPGRRGEAGEGVIVFRRVDDRAERSRVVRIAGGRLGAEARLQAASRSELRELFEASRPLS